MLTRFSKNILAVAMALTIAGCKDSTPLFEELSSDTNFISFTGGGSEYSVTLNSLGNSLVVGGVCDKRVKSLEISINGGTFLTSSDLTTLLDNSDWDCSDGTFFIGASDWGAPATALQYTSDPQTHTLEIRGLTFGGYSEVATLRVTYDSTATSNNAPVFTNLDTFTIIEDAAFSQTIAASDSDGDTVTFSVVSNDCGGLGFTDSNTSDNAAELSWAALDVGNDDVETCEIEVRASDTHTTVDQTISITVSNTDPGLSVSGTIDDLNEDDPDTVILAAGEVDSDDEGLGATYGVLQYSVQPYCNDTTTIGTLTIDPVNGETRFEPKPDWFGTCEFLIEIDDGNGGVVTDGPFNVNVTPVNDDPIISLVGCNAGPLTFNSAYSCSADTSDVDGPAETYSLHASDTCSFTINSGTGAISGTATADCTLHVQVTDGTSTDDVALDITVSPPPAPPAPTSVNLAAAEKTPGTTPTPTIVVTGVDDGDIVQIFSDSACSSAKSAESTPEAGGDGVIEVTTSALTQEIEYLLYAKTKRLGVWSDCSTDFAPYRYDNAPPTTSLQAQIISHSSNRTYYREDSVELLITFSEPVQISKSGTIPFVEAIVSDGSNSETIQFTYSRMRSSNEAVFTYEVSDLSLTMTSTSMTMTSNITAVAGSITDSAGRSTVANPVFAIPSGATLGATRVNDQRLCGGVIGSPGAAYDAIVGAAHGVPDFDYLICSEAQLRSLSANCRSGNSAACNKRFLLMDYIDFTATPFPPIGSNLAPFVGIFNGNLRGISEVIVNANNGDSTTSGAGFFGVLAGQANVSNLFLGGMTVTIPDLVFDTVSAGFLAGNAETTNPNFIILENIFIGNGSTMSSYSPHLGGLVGYATRVNATSTLIEATITQNQVTNGYQTGGIFGHASSATLVRSVFKGTISGKNVTGGLAGLAAGASSFTENIVEATVTITQGASVGGGLIGIIDSNQNVILQDNAFFGSVSNAFASAMTGGLVGSVPSVSVGGSTKNNIVVAQLAGVGVYGIVGDDIDNTNVVNAPFVGNFYSQEVSDGFLGDPNIRHATKKLGLGVSGPSRYKQNHYTEANWNFRSVWGIAEGSEYPFPKYIWFPDHFSHTIFVTTAAPTGGLNGLAGADELCRSEAQAASLPESWRYRAVLGDQFSAAKNRFYMDGDVKLVNGTLVAEDHIEFWSSLHSAAIDRTASGTLVSPQREVWSGSYPTGFTVANSHCNNWTDASAGSMGQFGLTDQIGAAWLDSANRSCSNTSRLYCMSRYSDYGKLNIDFDPGGVNFSSSYTQVNFDPLSPSGQKRLVRSDFGKLSGKYYFEVEVVDEGAGPAEFAIGFVNAVVISNSHLLDPSVANELKIGCTSSGGPGSCKMDGLAGGSQEGPAFNSNNSVFQVAVDIDSAGNNTKVWFGRDGTWINTGDPLCPNSPSSGNCPSFVYNNTIIGGLFPAASIQDDQINTAPRLRFRFKPSDWSNSAPNGFNAWAD